MFLWYSTSLLQKKKGDTYNLNNINVWKLAFMVKSYIYRHPKKLQHVETNSTCKKATSQPLMWGKRVHIGPILACIHLAVFHNYCTGRFVHYSKLVKFLILSNFSTFQCIEVLLKSSTKVSFGSFDLFMGLEITFLQYWPLWKIWAPHIYFCLSGRSNQI